LRSYLTATSATRPIALEDQLKAVDWIYSDARGANFNLDIYVPPVIPYSYEYLFLWQGTEKCGNNLCGLDKNNTLLNLYLLFEDDPPSPERLEAWLSKYEKNTRIEKKDRFGNINIEYRKRL